MERIKDTIYVETEFLGCNPSFIITLDGIVMIDAPQKPQEAFKWKKEIQKFAAITYLINTDHHRDHAIGNYYFDVNVIMHEGTLKKLHRPDYIELCKNWVKLLDPQSDSLINHYFVKKPKFTFTNKMSINMGQDVFELIHVRSHTEDETLVYMPHKQILFTGDTVCTNGIPSLYESYPLDWLEALKFIEELNFDVLVPGHGKIGNKDSVREFRKELSALIDRAQEKISRGLSKEEIINEMSYEDIVHNKYPSACSAILEQNMKLSIGRLYDSLVKN